MKGLISIAIVLLVVSCKKDQAPTICTGITMSGNKNVFVGKWRWYNTIVQEWFDVGTPINHDYTPSTEGFEYYFIITSTGAFNGYRNDTLIHSFLLDNLDAESFGSTINSIWLSKNCTSEYLELNQRPWNSTNDSILTPNYPLNFYDETIKRKTLQNYFVRE